MSRKSNKSNDTKLLQVYVEPELHKALQQYCIDNDKKNAPVLRELLSSFLQGQGYFKNQEDKEDGKERG